MEPVFHFSFPHFRISYISYNRQRLVILLTFQSVSPASLYITIGHMLLTALIVNIYSSEQVKPGASFMPTWVYIWGGGVCSERSSDSLWLHKESLIKLRIALSTLYSSLVSSTACDHVSLSKNVSVNFYSSGNISCTWERLSLAISLYNSLWNISKSVFQK